MKYKSAFAIVCPLFLLIPSVSRAVRTALFRASSLVPFPAAILAFGCLVLRPRLRRVIAAVETVLLLYFPLLGSAPYPVRTVIFEEDALRLCQSLASDAERYASFEPVSFAEAADECAFLTGGVVKLSRFPELMTLTRTAGVFVPLTGEAILNPREPAFTYPFLALHEIAHQSGLMNEGQASVRAYLWAMSSRNGAFRYSASVEALRRAVFLLREFSADKALRLVLSLSPRVQNDLVSLGALSESGAQNALFARVAGDYADLARFLLTENAKTLRALS